MAVNLQLLAFCQTSSMPHIPVFTLSRIAQCVGFLLATMARHVAAARIIVVIVPGYRLLALCSFVERASLPTLIISAFIGILVYVPLLGPFILFQQIFVFHVFIF
jgi:hypothetical protein